MSPRLTLEPNRWYACEILGEEFGPSLRSYTPIKVHRIEPGRTGRRQLTLDFYHANYPEGVRDKRYQLAILERASTFLLMKSQDHAPARYLLVYPISSDWLRNQFKARIAEHEDVEAWLDRNA